MKPKDMAKRYDAKMNEVYLACQHINGANKVKGKWIIPDDARMIYVPTSNKKSANDVYVYLLDAIIKKWDIKLDILRIPDEATLRTYLRELQEKGIVRLKEGRKEGNNVSDYVHTINAKDWQESRFNTKSSLMQKIFEICVEKTAEGTTTAVLKNMFPNI